MTFTLKTNIAPLTVTMVPDGHWTPTEILRTGPILLLDYLRGHAKFVEDAKVLILEYAIIFKIQFLVLLVDECATKTHNCHPKSTCTDTDEGFYCTCNPGYQSYGEGMDCTKIGMYKVTA